jgi:hypothetical protein
MNRLLLLPMLALAGCADPHEPLVPDFGNSVATDMAAQIINPGPNTGTGTFTSDGKRMSDALERYRTEHVYPPLPAIEAAVKAGSAPPDQPAPTNAPAQ